MPIIIDRRSGRRLGQLSEQDCRQLMAIFDEPTRVEDPYPFDPEIILDLADAGASEELIGVLQQLLQGREDFDLGIEPD